MKVIAPLLLVAFLTSSTDAQPGIFKSVANMLRKNTFIKKFVGMKTERADGKPWFCHELDCPSFTTIRTIKVDDDMAIEERCYDKTEWVQTTQDGDKKATSK